MKQIPAPQSDLHQMVKDFAKDHIYPVREKLIKSKEFPSEIWNHAAKSGLLGLAVSPEFSGSGATYANIAEFGYLLNRYGGVPGLTMSFTTHWLFPKLHIERLASAEQKTDLLPLVAEGKASLSVAISEPKFGAHPKHLKSSLVEEDGVFNLTGEKTFLTNGPLASHFLTLVVSGEENGIKEFSAILLPADTEGVQKTEGVTLSFLQPCPHGGIKFQNAKVPTSSLIGTKGLAFQEISHPTRVIEDAIGAFGLIGSLHSLFDDLARQNPYEKLDLLGAALSKLDALLPIAQHLANNATPENQNADALSHVYLGFRSIVEYILEELESIVKANGISQSPYAELLQRDIQKTLGIARSAQAVKLTKKGATYIQERAPSV
ncbi:hypothetical protein GUA87_00575 [Sneathiella sp. P13V-1]|uniref:acyl-CoA dehydrogenase family protein n=1 Tax=Sneathiella sp. P13V-1 TaxID=2697366 RepID=UPI00187B43BD|nr:acyl-CoA dehydrogenase family protein [Sneathiella sp. P13V-1]MBE7635322.1 hypothetical protein [Sneathiella sp. P13V-1]